MRQQVRPLHLVLCVLSTFATIVIVAATGGSSIDPKLVASLQPAAPKTIALPGGAPAPVAAAPAETAPADDAPVDVPDSAPAEATPAVAASVPAEEPTDDGSTGTVPSSTPPAADAPRPTHIEHVFMVVLAGRGFDETFGPASPATYLNGQLRPQGTLLPNVASLGAGDLADHLALISGQPPNDDTKAGCSTYTEIPQTATPDDDGVIDEKGCAYPNTITTVADQVTASGRVWKGYVEDVDKTGRPSCRRPGSNQPDDAQTERPGDGYATRHNPFVYFHSLLDLGGCDANDGPLAKLDEDLKTAKTTPAFAYVVPNLCNDGTDTPCLDGTPGGLVAADTFLATWAPKILASPAFKDHGVLVVAFAGGTAKANGALVVSRYATAGAQNEVELDPYGLLRTTEDVLALKPLARAKTAPSLLDGVLAAARINRPGDD